MKVDFTVFQVQKTRTNRERDIGAEHLSATELFSTQCEIDGKGTTLEILDPVAQITGINKVKLTRKVAAFSFTESGAKNKWFTQTAHSSFYHLNFDRPVKDLQMVDPKKENHRGLLNDYQKVTPQLNMMYCPGYQVFSPTNNIVIRVVRINDF